MTHPLTAPLIAKRAEVGAETPLGRRYSMAIEVLNNIDKAETDEQRASLQTSLATAIAGIEQIQRDGGQYVHGNHGAQR